MSERNRGKTYPKSLNYNNDKNKNNNNNNNDNNNNILAVPGEWSKDLDVTLQNLLGSKAKVVLKKMQKASLSGTLNIARTFKVII